MNARFRPRPFRRWSLRPCVPNKQGDNRPRTFWFKPLSSLWLGPLNDGCDDSHLLALPRSLAPGLHGMLGIPAFCLTTVSGALASEVTLSRQLHTAPLPAPHVPVGYR